MVTPVAAQTPLEVFTRSMTTVMALHQDSPPPGGSCVRARMELKLDGTGESLPWSPASAESERAICRGGRQEDEFRPERVRVSASGEYGSMGADELAMARESCGACGPGQRADWSCSTTSFNLCPWTSMAWAMSCSGSPSSRRGVSKLPMVFSAANGPLASSTSPLMCSLPIAAWACSSATFWSITHAMVMERAILRRTSLSSGEKAKSRRPPSAICGPGGLSPLARDGRAARSTRTKPTRRGPQDSGMTMELLLGSMIHSWDTRLASVLAGDVAPRTMTPISLSRPSMAARPEEPVAAGPELASCTSSRAPVSKL
mmetsp:Transcript_34807/g.98684  ORF Transcript_34807/g.98684 Transcript_34807/m.98684 type:complete len:316 (+) Transcript_34807:604-1551(+)